MENKIGLIETEIVGSIVGAFYEVYNYFGCGLLESVYCAAVEDELRRRDHKVSREVAVPVIYKGHRVAWQRIDLIVDDRVILEAKATEQIPAFCERQILSYLNVTRFEVALLLHFGLEPRFKKFVHTLDRRRRGPFGRRS